MDGHLSVASQNTDKNEEHEQMLKTRIATDAFYVGQEPEQWSGHAVVPPISMATTFKHLVSGELVFYGYSRFGNPTPQCFEECLASLEKAKYSLTFSPGLSATTTTIMFMLKSRDHILSIDDIYGGTGRLFRFVVFFCRKKFISGWFPISTRCMVQMGVESSFTDMSKHPSFIIKHFESTTCTVSIETPTNLLLKLADIEYISTAIHKYDPEIMVLVDNTFATPYYQSRLELGSDLVLHSLTEYMNGHSDVVMGCLMVNNEERYKQLSFLQYAM